MIKIEKENLKIQQIKTAKKLLLKFSDVFSHSDHDTGHTSSVHHRIDLADDTPFKQRPQHTPWAMFKEVKEHLQQLLDGEIIRKFKSTWSSNVVLCRKKNVCLQ